jgi:lipid-A-disaccharide synthase
MHQCHRKNRAPIQDAPVGIVPPRIKAECISYAAHVATVLVTAFEPSGDAHAAPLVRALRALAPDVRVVGWGGPKMRAAGCEMAGETARDGAMTLVGLKKISEVRRIVADIRTWAAVNPVDVHVPVDSPAANWHIASWMKQHGRGAAGGSRVVNLVAPQLWAWAPWRIRKWRRTSDAILCLLPFEEEWFRSRGVRAHFIGHPVLGEPVSPDALMRAKELPSGMPKLLLLPGSRSSEVRANMPLMLEVFRAVTHARPGLVGLVMAANDALVPLVHAAARGAAWPSNLHVASNDPDAAIAWCDCALNVSGTVSLDLAHQRKPMVALYRTGFVKAAGSAVVLLTPHRLLPNIIARREIVPEFIPHAGGAGPVARALEPLLDDAVLRARISRDLDAVTRSFEGHDPGREAAEVVLGFIDREPGRAEARPMSIT